MAKNFIELGETINLVATKAIASGDVVFLQDLCGVAITDINKDELGALSVEGVWEIKAKAGDNIKQGQKVYWSDADKEVTITAASNKVIGIAWADCPATKTLARVKINA